MDVFEAVAEFHQKFGFEKGSMSGHMENLKAIHLGEELKEYLVACSRGDEASQLDALVDLIYVAAGAVYLYGWDGTEAFRRVHEANMTKIRAEKASDSKRGSTFDVVKPEGFVSPDLSDLVAPVE